MDKLRDILLQKGGLEKEEKAFDSLEAYAAGEELEVFLSENVEGKNIIGAVKDGREYYFNSRYADRELAESWASQDDLSNYNTIVIVFGMGNGEYIRALRRKNENMLIMVFEPSYSIALLNRDALGIKDLLEDENILIAVGKESYGGLYDIMGLMITYEVFKYTKLYRVPNYEHFFKEEWLKIRDMYKDCMERVVVNRNTLLAMGREMTFNMSKNVTDYIEQYSLSDLIDAFKDLDKKDIPAIVVAAGPSLDKNISELKRAKGKAFIIAVDTAINPMVRSGIIPDISVTVDPHKPLVLFKDEAALNLPLVFSMTSNARIKSIHEGKRIYQEIGDSIVEKYRSRYKKKAAGLESGGSVAHDGFSLAQRLGFKTVIFAGLDLAYPNDMSHSESVYAHSQKIDYDKAKKTIFLEVEDIYGNKVTTEYNMNMYRLWFEHAINVHSDMKFIDATEGGAKIKGMEIMTLREAIDRETRSETCVDFSEIINSIDKHFTDEEQKAIIEDIIELPQHMAAVRKRIDKGLRAYEKLDEFNRRQKYTGREFERNFEVITEINNWLSSDEEVAYLNMYASEIDYQVREVILEEKGSVYGDIKLMADNGIKLLKALKEAADIAEKDMAAVIEELKEKAED